MLTMNRNLLLSELIWNVSLVSAKIMKRDGEENDTEEFFSKLIYLGIHKVMIGSSHVHI